MTAARISARISFAAAFFLVFLGVAGAAETLVGTYGEMRTVLAFKIPDEAVQNLLPAGWEAVPGATGPPQGANLNVIFIDWGP